MKSAALLLAIGAVAACSSIPDAGNGVVELVLTIPDSLVVIVDSGSVTLHARALDIHGDSVASAPIFWETPDTMYVTLDSVTGVMTGKAVGSARVQARTGTLISDDNLAFTVRAPDTNAVIGIRRRP
jgi:hypothetical protein